MSTEPKKYTDEFKWEAVRAMEPSVPMSVRQSPGSRIVTFPQFTGAVVLVS